MKDNRKIFNMFATVGEKVVAFEERWMALIILFTVEAMLVLVAFGAYRTSNGLLFISAITGFVAVTTFLGLCLALGYSWRK